VVRCLARTRPAGYVAYAEPGHQRFAVVLHGLPVLLARAWSSSQTVGMFCRSAQARHCSVISVNTQIKQWLLIYFSSQKKALCPKKATYGHEFQSWISFSQDATNKLLALLLTLLTWAVPCMIVQGKKKFPRRASSRNHNGSQWGRESEKSGGEMEFLSPCTGWKSEISGAGGGDMLSPSRRCSVPHALLQNLLCYPAVLCPSHPAPSS
jgi:hypothetical protein